MTSTEQTPAPRMRRSLRILLAASLALNILVLAAFGGAVAMRGKWQGHAGAGMMGGALTHALTPEDRHAIRDQMRAMRGDAAGARAARRAAHDGLIEDLRRVPFEPERVAAHLQTRRQQMNERLELGQTLLLQRLSAMSDAERAAFADRVSEYDKRRAGK